MVDNMNAADAEHINWSDMESSPFKYEQQFEIGRTIPNRVAKALIHGAQEWYDHIYECARWQPGGLVEWYEDDIESVKEFREVASALAYMLKYSSTRTFPEPTGHE